MKNHMGFTSDEYRHSRGGWSRYLEITCAVCQGFLFFYQKDGPGPLKRCYLDRMMEYSPKFDRRGYHFCPQCQACLGFSEPYTKEANRPAMRVASQAIKYKIVSKKEVSNK